MPELLSLELKWSYMFLRTLILFLPSAWEHMCMKAEDIEKRQTALAERQMCDPTKIKEATQLILNSP